MRLYTPQGSQIDTKKTEGDVGLAKFSKLAAGDYVACEDKHSGWSNTQPGSTNVAFGDRSCYSFHVEVGQTAKIYFGNRKSTTVVIDQEEDDDIIVEGKIISATPDNMAGIIIVTTPDNPAEEDDPDAPTAGAKLYLPLINNQ